jgi:hypothetical protein
MRLGQTFRSLDQPDHPYLPYGFRNEAVAAMLPNKRLKLAALRLKEALCCLVFEMSAAALARSVRLTVGGP